MDKCYKNENSSNIIFNPISALNFNKQNNTISYEQFIKEQNNNILINNDNTIKNINESTPHKANNYRFNFMNSLYTNFLTYNLLQNNNRNNNINTKINSLLIDFNNELKNEEEKEKEPEEKGKEAEKNTIVDNSNNNRYDFTPLIETLESQDDPRFKQSRFLKLIKDINTNKIRVNEENNILEENTAENTNNPDTSNNELEELLNQAEKYINYSREDLATNILELILDNILIKLPKNKSILEKTYLYLIICELNSGEDLNVINLIIDLINIIFDSKNNKNFFNNNQYLNKEYINKINQRNFDINDKISYENYINNKKTIKNEAENSIKNLLLENKNENHNETFLLIYGLLLILNENYTSAEEIFNQLIILNASNYFYYNILGVIYTNLNLYDNAIKYYKKAVELNPEFPKCLINLGILYSKQNKIMESCEWIIKGLKIYEDIPQGWNQLLSNVIELDLDELICEINSKNLINIEKILFKK